MLSPLCAIVDSDAAARAGWAVADLARAYVDGGARFLQLRAKQLAGGALLDLASAVVAMARAADAVVIVNDRADIARLAGADGVHVGQDDLSPRAVRRIVGGDATVGLSTHTEAQLDAASAEPISYVAIGPTYTTATKVTGYEPVGLRMVRRATRVGVPVVAIGGITLDNAPAAIDAGAAAVAVINDLLATGDPARRVAEFLARLEAHAR